MADSVPETVISEVSASKEDSAITESVLESVIVEVSASEEFTEASVDVLSSTDKTEESFELLPHAVKGIILKPLKLPI